jgi:hypothetical protein
MKITQNQAIFLGLGVLAAFILVKNIKGKKDSEPNFASEPKFTNPFALS